jgi:hypothetical protein
VVSGLVAAISGCSGGGPSTSTSARPGQFGSTYLVTVSRQTGGEVTSGDGRIACGTVGKTCGPAAYAWDEQAVLTATPDAGNMFATWAGDCVGRQQVDGAYVCVLDTATYGADKFVAAVFGEAGRTQHVNFTDPALHGPEFLSWIAKEPNAFECTYCHGVTYNGAGTAPSCTDCHARSGYPNWLANCNFCHLAPPQNGIHPAVSSDTTTCWGCHQGTVDRSGGIIAGGNHMNGNVDATGGHAAGYNDPQIHGNDFLSAVASDPAAPYCTSCHGASYEILIASGRSCNTCHAAPTTEGGGGWSGTEWKSNCTFCHGQRTPVYTAADLDLAAPPDAISQRLTGVEVPDRTGQHALHLLNGGFVPAPRFQCSTCHPIPATLAHVSVERRAAVTIEAASAFPALGTAELARLPSPLGIYDPVAGTCTSYCHGVPNAGGVNTLMKWTNDYALATPIQDCTDCHALPPPTGANVIGNAYATAPTNTRYCGTTGCNNHEYHRRALQANGYDSCANCHYGSAQGTYYAGLHVNGKPDMVYSPAGTGLKAFTATWDPVNRSCTASCHVNSGPSTVQRW